MDRTSLQRLVVKVLLESLSARRAWIEISGGITAVRIKPVALREESVDRNTDELGEVKE